MPSKLVLLVEGVTHKRGVRLRILGPACSGPYASFECIGRSPPLLLYELCPLLTGTAVEGVTHKRGVIEL